MKRTGGNPPAGFCAGYKRVYTAGRGFKIGADMSAPFFLFRFPEAPWEKAFRREKLHLQNLAESSIIGKCILWFEKTYGHTPSLNY
jgi:hypothetical protein